MSSTDLLKVACVIQLLYRQIAVQQEAAARVWNNGRRGRHRYSYNEPGHSDLFGSLWSTRNLQGLVCHHGRSVCGGLDSRHEKQMKKGRSQQRIKMKLDIRINKARFDAKPF